MPHSDCLSGSGACLYAPKRSVQSAERQQFFVGALLPNFLLVDDINAIGVANCGKPVRDDDHAASRPHKFDRAENRCLRLDERVGRPGHSLLLTSNRSPSDWYPLFPNAVVGESVLDRVINSSHHLLIDGKSYRPNRRPGQATKP